MNLTKNKNNQLLEELKQHISCINFDILQEDQEPSLSSFTN